MKTFLVGWDDSLFGGFRKQEETDFLIERMEMCQSHHTYWKIIERNAVADVSSPKTLVILVHSRSCAVCRVPGLHSAVEEIRPADPWLRTDFALSDALDCSFSEHTKLSSCFRRGSLPLAASDSNHHFENARPARFLLRRRVRFGVCKRYPSTRPGYFLSSGRYRSAASAIFSPSNSV